MGWSIQTAQHVCLSRRGTGMDTMASRSTRHALHPQRLSDNHRHNSSKTTSRHSSDLIHPMRSMQGPFEESLLESALDCAPVRVGAQLTALERRQRVLQLGGSDGVQDSRWHQKPGSRFHPLQKLIAQISFGIHVLHKHHAKSELEVTCILQRHVDELDSFCEDTDQDFALARSRCRRAVSITFYCHYNIAERSIGCFARITFRNAIVEGNIIIERVVESTSKAVQLAVADITRGLESIGKLSQYLNRIGSEWTAGRDGMLEVYNAMMGNASAWYGLFGGSPGEGH